jgi:hypothetical protein
MTDAGFPGTSRTRKKVKIVSAKSTGIIARRRRMI